MAGQLHRAGEIAENGPVQGRFSAYSVILKMDLAIFVPLCYTLKKTTVWGETIMRQRRLRVVVTFHTTAGAMAAESACRRLGLEGKLISVPRQLTSDCGIAWSAPPELRETLETSLAEAGVETAGFYQITV